MDKETNKDLKMKIRFALSWKALRETNEVFGAVVKTHKRQSNKIYNSELNITKI